MRLFIDLIEARLRAPFFSATHRIRARRLVLVRLVGADGEVGYGEAAPLETYGGVTVEDVLAALEACREPLSLSDGDNRRALLAECAGRARLPQALAALDLALWDLAGRRTGKPLWQLLGVGEAPTVEVNATVAVADPEAAGTLAALARSSGFRCIKVKVGLTDDPRRLAAVRAAAGEEMRIRLDANGAWSADEAIAALETLGPTGIELCEEPAAGLEQIAQVVAGSAVPVALDESATAPGALDRQTCDAVCLKISAWGGVSGLLAAARRAHATGYRAYLASTLDGPLGIAAALHVASVVEPNFACGLATLPLFDGRADPLPARDGAMSAPPGPGLGDGLLDWYG